MKNRLKVFRAMHDLTQESLAKKLDVTRSTIVSIEKGKYDPSIGLAFKISNLFNVKIEDVFEYRGDKGGIPGIAAGVTNRSWPSLHESLLCKSRDYFIQSKFVEFAGCRQAGICIPTSQSVILIQHPVIFFIIQRLT